MATLPINDVGVSGAKPNMTPADVAGDLAPVGAHLFLVAKNTNAASRTVTIATPGSLETGDAYPDKQYTLAATTGEQWIPLLGVYRDPADGKAHITYSAVADVTVAVVRAAL